MLSVQERQTMETLNRKTAFSGGRNAHSAWSKCHDRLTPECWPALRPSFQVPMSAKVFTIGSCFARNIEEHVARLGYNVPMLDFAVPNSEWSARPNGILNKYTPAAIYQEIKWTYDNVKGGDAVFEDTCESLMFRTSDGKVIDTALGGFVAVTEERFYERRREVLNVFRKVFESECVTITLGLIEAWYDQERQIYIQKAPIERAFQEADPERFTFKVLSFTECFDFIDQSVRLIAELNPKARVLITTSPVSLARTFTEQDVIVANMHSKSTLRAVCGEIQAQHDHVDYFPSYESVMLTRSWRHWDDDKIHVSDAFVGKIVARLIEAYFPDVAPSQIAYQRASIEIKEGNFDAALEQMRLAVELEPERMEYELVLADILLRRRERGEAWEILRAAEKRGERGFPLFRKLSQIAMLEGRRDEAIDYARRAVEVETRNADLYAHLGDLMAQKGDEAETHRAFERAAEVGPQNPHVWRRYSIALGRLGDTEGELRMAEKAVAVRPHHGEIRGHLIDLLLKAGRCEEARLHLEEAKALKPPPRRLAEFQRRLNASVT